MKFSRALHSLFVGSRNNDCILRINGRACTMGYDKGQRDRKDDVMELRVLRYFLTVAQEGNIFPGRRYTSCHTADIEPSDDRLLYEILQNGIFKISGQGREV